MAEPSSPKDADVDIDVDAVEQGSIETEPAMAEPSSPKKDDDVDVDNVAVNNGVEQGSTEMTELSPPKDELDNVVEEQGAIEIKPVDEVTENVVEQGSMESKAAAEVANSSRSHDGLHKRKPSIPAKTPRFEDGDHRNLAAVKLQKVYKSFRTRRQLADCAVLAEQKWWQVLDLAELKHSSISFFDIEKSESIVSKWSRARTRAAKVGKGLSKDEKARKLALQHWLEAIDPRHRYGHNLQFYYVRWLHCESKQPFFYWLDIGDGREVNVVERCPRSRLQQQCIKYLDSTERDGYEVVVEKGKLVYRANQRAVDTTTGEAKGSKWIFVLSATKTLYVGQKIKGNFQHSSFLAGGATLSAGRLVADNGILTAVWPHSGHYLPTEENFQAFMSFLKENDVDLTFVQKSPVDDDEESFLKTTISNTGQLRTDENNSLAQYEFQRRKGTSKLSELVNSSILRRSQLIQSKIARLNIPKTTELVEEEFQTPGAPPEPSPDNNVKEEEEEQEDEDYNFSSSGGYATAEDSLLSEDDFIYPKLNIFQRHKEFENEEPIPQETILQRINSHKRTRSYQLGQHLGFRWTTGAGPRIGCVRDYPSRLQFEVLEQVQLSPRSRGRSCDFSPSSMDGSPKVLTPTGLPRRTPSRSNLCPENTNVASEDL